MERYIILGLVLAWALREAWNAWKVRRLRNVLLENIDTQIEVLRDMREERVKEYEKLYKDYNKLPTDK